MHADSEIMNIMNKLHISREEALEVLAYDDDVATNKATQYDLSPEQKAVVQKLMRQTDHKKIGEIKRKRKPNEIKESIIAELADFLKEDAQDQVYEDVVITNPNRMIHFKVNDKEFDLQLIEKRPPKEK
jgi:hypothetical protein